MLLRLDFDSTVPLYMQLRNQVVNAIAEGELKYGQRLTPVRALAEESGVNAMTVSKAYQLLDKEGYIHTDRRRGAVVCWQGGEGSVTDETLENLRLCLSELRLSGITKAETLKLCDMLYEEGTK